MDSQHTSFLPSDAARVNQSFYERLRNPEAEAAAGLQNLDNRSFDGALDGDATFDQLSLMEESRPLNRRRNMRSTGRSDEYDDNNDVPESLLVEVQHVSPIKVGQSPPLNSKKGKQAVRDRSLGSIGSQTSNPPPHIAGTSSGFAPVPAIAAPRSVHHTLGSVMSNPREKALWKWVNVTNLDSFMGEVYDYFDGNGIWCILVDKVLHIVASLSEVIVPKCTQRWSGLWNLGIWLYSFYFIWKCVQFFTDTRRLLDIRNFYIHLLCIPEEDMQTISWQDVVARIMALRDANPSTALNLLPGPAQFIGGQSKERLDAHDIANRLMRRDNYFIAMINKDILDVSFTVPFLGRKQVLSRTLEWYLYYCIIDFVFDYRGQVHPDFLKAESRAILSEKLRQRFVFAAAINLILSPFMLAYALIVHFFTYYNEYQRDPSKASARRYTPLAEWRLREFNELPHIFEDRLKMSYPFATRYLDQFPKKLSDRVFRTISFISGSLLAVLAIATLLDEKMFLGFEITHERTVLFYLGVLGVIWKGSRDSIQEETLVFDPEYAMTNVIEYTRYMPDSWETRLHSFEVKQEFADMYKMKLVVFLEELIGIITAPLVLWTSMPKCSDQIIDFFREFTIHVDGLGYVCSFAVFDFKKGVGQGTKTQAPADDVRGGYYTAKHGKMAASYYGFLDNYVINPKTGIPGHLPLSQRPQYHEDEGRESAFGATDSMPPQRMGKDGKENTSRSRGPNPRHQAGRAPRFAFGVQDQLSPLGSLLLDPHHQPSASVFAGSRSMHRAGARPARNAGFDRGIMEESSEGRCMEDGSSGGLGESVWQTSVGRANAQDKSTGNEPGGDDPGVLGLIRQLKQTRRNHKAGSNGTAL
ncbi:Autophagy-related protein 9 [Ceratocystis lukuohia]|uniref:Autophagy-related protein 9 n=1 Tax=Ceratocystis lukuohia TaxID=2019550 RepID=A0ABR4ML98_9PEZI